MQSKIFGEIVNDAKYKERVAAYILLFDEEGKIAVVRTPSGKVFLPGGKIEIGESKEECLIRECMEEAGIRVTPDICFAKGERYFYRDLQQEYSHVIGYFYTAKQYEKISEPTEPNHQLLWLSVKEACQVLFHEHHKWAVELIK